MFKELDWAINFIGLSEVEEIQIGLKSTIKIIDVNPKSSVNIN